MKKLVPMDEFNTKNLTSMDNRIKKLKAIVALLAVIFTLGLIMLTMMIPIHNFFTISILAVQAVVIIYFAALTLDLIRDNAEHERADRERERRQTNQPKQSN